MDIVISQFKDDQTEALVELWKKCNLVVPWNDPYEDIKLKTSFQPELLFVAELNDKMVGTVMVGYEGHRGWINYLAVDPDVQLKGLGRRIMEYAEEVLTKMGCVKINLQVRETNTGVITFYEKIGYKRDAVVSFGKRLKEAE